MSLRLRNPPSKMGAPEEPEKFTKYYCQNCDEAWQKTQGKRCPACKKPAEPLTELELEAEAEAKAQAAKNVKRIK